MNVDPRHRLYGLGLAVWLAFALIGAAIIVVEWLADWGGLDEPQVWTVPPRVGGGL